MEPECLYYWINVYHLVTYSPSPYFNADTTPFERLDVLAGIWQSPVWLVKCNLLLNV